MSLMPLKNELMKVEGTWKEEFLANGDKYNPNLLPQKYSKPASFSSIKIPSDLNIQYACEHEIPGEGKLLTLHANSQVANDQPRKLPIE